MDKNNQIERLVELTVNVIIDEIRIHRKTHGLDPVWGPTKTWLNEEAAYLRKGFKAILQKGD